MSYGSDMVQSIGQNRADAAGSGTGAAGNGVAAQSGSWAPNAAASKDASMADFYSAVKKDMAQNDANRVNLPQQQAQAPPLSGIQQFARPSQFQQAQFQQPPVITGYNL